MIVMLICPSWESMFQRSTSGEIIAIRSREQRHINGEAEELWQTKVRTVLSDCKLLYSSMIHREDYSACGKSDYKGDDPDVD
ncbi:hypothetical protein CS542_06560 [Pedobacter sp. IW39]|nr:hypothetical protein CS542_06560 [Pedobacter sp. IW39]